MLFPVPPFRATQATTHATFLACLMRGSVPPEQARIKFARQSRADRARSSFFRCSTSDAFRFVPAVQQSFWRGLAFCRTVCRLHHCITASLHHCITAPPHYHVSASVRGCIAAQLHQRTGALSFNPSRSSAAAAAARRSQEYGRCAEGYAFSLRIEIRPPSQFDGPT